MTRNTEPWYERERECRIKAVQAQMSQQERTTRVGVFWLSILATIVLIGAGGHLISL